LHTSDIILRNLIKNEEYTKRVLPFIEEEYFSKQSEKDLFKHVRAFVGKYNVCPTIEALFIELSNDKTIKENVIGDIDKTLGEFKEDYELPQIDWLITTTEDFCKQRAIENAIHESISIIEGESKLTSGAIPDIVQKALAVSFNKSVGHDYIEDAEKRFEYYHRKEEKVKLGLEFLNKVTKGGFSKKTLNLFLSATHGGKSALMCFLAAQNLMEGDDVLYISLEMAEEEIAKRIDANLMNVTFDDLMLLSEKMFFDKMSSIKKRTLGKLITKEYPTGAAHVGHVKNLLNELRLKKNFTPKIIYIDYLNIMTSFRIKPGTLSNTYLYNKSISEELRGLAVEEAVPIVSASQFNRMGATNGDPNMEDISESFGVNFTADWIAALISSDELISQNQMLIKQLKSRYDDKNRIPKFLVGFDRLKMQFSNVNDPLKGISYDPSALPQGAPVSNGLLAAIKQQGNNFEGFS